MMNDQEADEALDATDGDPAGAAPVQPPEAGTAPEWLVDFRRSAFPRGFYRSGQGHGVVFTDRGGDTLVVSFDNLSSARDDSIDRTPWGYGFVAKNGWSQLGVMTFATDWFRNEELLEYLDSLAKSGFFQRFRKVVMTGTSMGGYAACAFASLSPGCTVIAFSPQSTLKKDLVPWEKRFSSGRRSDWSGAHADGAEESRAADKVFIVYDPLFAEDVQHVDRFTGPNVVRLRARYAGHKSALFLRRAGLLSSIVRETVEGGMSETRFYQMYRGGRALPWYMNAVAARISEGKRFHLLPRLAKAFSSLGFEQMARVAIGRAVDAGVIERPRPAQARPRPQPPRRRQPARPAAAPKAVDGEAQAEDQQPQIDLYMSDPNLPPLGEKGELPWQDAIADQDGAAEPAGGWRAAKKRLGN